MVKANYIFDRNKLKDLRNERGFNRRELSREIYIKFKADISDEAIKTWEEKGVTPSAINLLYISMFFNLKMKSFLKKEVN